jgi:predicted phage terminase large subunit-like protein
MYDNRRTLLLAAKRLEALQRARNDLMTFIKLMKPDPEDVDDVDRSLYEETPVARILVDIMHRVDRGILKRVCVSMPPQVGKSEVLSRNGPAWLSGRKPSRNMILGSYNQDFADEFGSEVRSIFQNQAFKAVFPEHHLRKGGGKASLLRTSFDGKLSFVGIGGSGTGKPADYFFVDDPIRNDADAQSPTYREMVWNWFTKVAMTRVHADSAIMVVQTRWSEDDLIGRLADPEHPERNGRFRGIDKRWTYINIPAVIEDPKLANALNLKLEPPTNPDVVSMFGTNPMCSIWARRKPLDFYAEAKEADARGFSALQMGRPTPEDGDQFKAEWLVEYDREDLPSDLVYYGASDHAVSTKEGRDYTVIGCVGIDSKDNIWVLPDLVWKRLDTRQSVDNIVLKMQTYQPAMWWMESELISKSFGPFLYERMDEEKVYVVLDPMTPSKDKPTRARSIEGRMSMKKVRFPRFASWWPEAKAQLLKFPYGSHDDFVDWLSWIGLGLLKQRKAQPVANDNPRDMPPVGTVAWVVRSSMLTKSKDRIAAARKGW